MTPFARRLATLCLASALGPACSSAESRLRLTPFTDSSGDILAVTQGPGASLSFKLRLRGNRGSAPKALNGIAKAARGDAEVLETPTGDAIPATEYIYAKHSCWISISLAYDETISRVKIAGCGVDRLGSTRWLTRDASDRTYRHP